MKSMIQKLTTAAMAFAVVSGTLIVLPATAFAEGTGQPSQDQPVAKKKKIGMIVFDYVAKQIPTDASGQGSPTEQTDATAVKPTTGQSEPTRPATK